MLVSIAAGLVIDDKFNQPYPFFRIIFPIGAILIIWRITSETKEDNVNNSE